MSEKKLSFEDTKTAFAQKSDQELKLTRFLFGIMNYPFLLKTGMALIRQSIGWAWVQRIIKKTIFRQFCGGESLEQSTASIDKLMEAGIYTYPAYSVEGKINEEEFEHTTDETLRTIEFAAGKKAIPFAVFKVTGLAEFALLEKVQKGDPLEEQEKAAFERVRQRVERICSKGLECNVRVLIDAEESWIQLCIDDLAYKMMEKYNRQQVLVYNTIQMYRSAGLNLLKEAYHRAVEKNHFLGIKQVRGAYLVKESERALRMGYPNPLNPTKEATDRMYNEALEFCLRHIERIGLLAGTHNEQSCYELFALMMKYQIPLDHPHIFVGQLYGMSDHITFNMAKNGCNAIKYVPFGTVVEVIPYLFRRAQENSSIAGQGNREYELVRKELKRRQKNSDFFNL